MTAPIDDVATTLAQAFAHDPLMCSFFPYEQNSSALSYYTFRFLISHSLANGEVTLAHANNQIVGAALWLASENAEHTLMDEIRHGGIAMLDKQGVKAILRQIRASAQMQQLHETLINAPHYYLYILGLIEEARGQGLATQLITPMLERADLEQKSCYLDTHNEANINLYRHYGFEVVHEGVMKGLKVRHWVMIRQPRNS
ncbi:GNAT family N-acetyltransferase [Thalassolituus oleivorans]|uniref:GNAT family N-acetyltransferase n=1 Tax=Thalassolituus oleivorans TaxID=187493 RepID=UPI0030C7FA6A